MKSMYYLHPPAIVYLKKQWYNLLILSSTFRFFSTFGKTKPNE